MMAVVVIIMCRSGLYGVITITYMCIHVHFNTIGGINMLVVLLVVLFVIVVVLATAVTVLVKGNESLKAQHRAYVSSVNSVYDNHSNVIVGLQEQVEELLTRRADDQEVISKKDLHIAGLVEEVKKATKQVAVLEKLAAEKEAELSEATASEFALKAKLANTSANYAKVEAYALGTMKKASPSIFGDCNPRLDEKFVFEDELDIVWFK